MEIVPARLLFRILFAIVFVGITFLLLEQTHQIARKSLQLILADWHLDWQRDPFALALDRVCYAIFITGAGWLVFRRWLVGPEPNADERPLVPSRWRRLAIGCATGVVLFAAVTAFHYWMASRGLRPVPHRTALAAALDSDWRILLYHLIFTAAVTAALEELFFRGCLQHFLARQGAPTVIAIILPAVLFGLVHPPSVGPVLFVVGLGFGFLFWRYGPGSAILAHTVYNALLLIARFLFQE